MISWEIEARDECPLFLLYSPESIIYNRTRWYKDYVRAKNSGVSNGIECYEFHLFVFRSDKNFDGSSLSMIELAARVWLRAKASGGSLFPGTKHRPFPPLSCHPFTIVVAGNVPSSLKPLLREVFMIYMHAGYCNLIFIELESRMRERLFDWLRVEESGEFSSSKWSLPFLPFPCHPFTFMLSRLATARYPYNRYLVKKCAWIMRLSWYNLSWFNELALQEQLFFDDCVLKRIWEISFLRKEDCFYRASSYLLFSCSKTLWREEVCMNYANELI